MTVQCGSAGYHSGEVGGIVPETFRVVRALCDRLDNSLTGEPMEELRVPVPQWKQAEAEFMANLAGDDMCTKYSMADGVKYCH